MLLPFSSFHAQYDRIEAQHWYVVFRDRSDDSWTAIETIGNDTRSGWYMEEVVRRLCALC
jgi:hypothetical protein